MEGVVEALFREGDEVVLDILPPIESFMSDPIRVCALRLVLLGLADKTRKAEFSFTALFSEWNRLLGLMGGRGDRAAKRKLEKGLEINENAIRRYVFVENNPRDPNRMAALLTLLAVHEINRHGGVDGSSRRLAQAAQNAVDFIEPILVFLKTREPSSLNLGMPTPGLEAMALKSLRALLKVDPEDQDTIARWFFREPDASKLLSTNERSYYSLYRYSTQLPEIVKTLLVIESPALSGLGCFSFTHVYLSKRDKVKRISRGTLVSFPQAIYFLGMSAPVLRGRDPLGRPNIDKPQGLKVIVVPASEAQNGYDLLAGIYMSNGLRWNPIVGRIALVHIGFQSVVGSLSDANEEIKPAILDGPDALVDDLRKISSIPRSALADESVIDLAKRTLIRINNRPYCDSDRPNLPIEGIMRALQSEDEQIPGP